MRTTKLISLFLTILICLAFASPSLAQQTTATNRFVKQIPTGSANCTTWANACDLQTALGLAGPGDFIWVAAGVHKPTNGSDRSISFVLKEGVKLYGGFPTNGGTWAERNWLENDTFLCGDIGTAGYSADNSYHVIKASNVSSLTVLDGFNIQNGTANAVSSPDFYGGGIYLDSADPTLTDLIFWFNEAEYGAGIYNYLGNTSLTNVTFFGNAALNDGGGMLNFYGNPILENVDFFTNNAGSGAGFHNTGGSPILTDVEFEQNTASGSGGGLFSRAGTGVGSAPILESVVFDRNKASAGGGLYYSQTNGSLHDVVFYRNTATSNGGGMHNNASQVSLIGVEFNYNSAVILGGAVYNSSNSRVNFSDVIFYKNTTGQDGGAMANISQSKIYMQEVQFHENEAGRWGGAVYNDSSDVNFEQVLIGQNTSVSDGAGIANFNSALTLTDVTLRLNTISGPNGDGAALLNYGSLSLSKIKNVTFDSNQATAYGGALFNYQGSVELTNTTFYNNWAGSMSAGIYNISGGQVWMTHATFYKNLSPSYPDELFTCATCSSRIYNSVFWEDTTTDPLIYLESGGTGTAHNNVIKGGCPEDFTCSAIYTANPLFGVFADHGGFTNTIPLQSGSSALDRALADYCPLTDQRGFYRPTDGNADSIPACDIGAFESYSTPAKFNYLPVILR